MTEQTHTAVVTIPDVDDPTSVARTAAGAALSLLAKVSAEQRGSVTIDRVAITNAESIDVPGNILDALLLDRAASRRALVLMATVHDEKPADTTQAAQGDC